MQLTETLPRALAQHAHRAELDRLRGARLRACRRHAVLLAVVTQCAFMRAPVIRIAVEHPERAGGYTESASVANILLHVHIAEFVEDERAGRTGLLAGRLCTVLADIAHHEPSARTGAGLELFHERDVPPRGGRERDGVVVTGARPAEPVGRQLVPLLAGPVARLTA